MSTEPQSGSIHKTRVRAGGAVAKAELPGVSDRPYRRTAERFNTHWKFPEVFNRYAVGRTRDPQPRVAALHPSQAQDSAARTRGLCIQPLRGWQKRHPSQGGWRVAPSSEAAMQSRASLWVVIASAENCLVDKPPTSSGRLRRPAIEGATRDPAPTALAGNLCGTTTGATYN